MARDLVRKTYEQSYATDFNHQAANGKEGSDTASNASDHVSMFYHSYFTVTDRFIQSLDEKHTSMNIFDNLPTLARSKKVHVHDELTAYLSTDVEAVDDALQWWYMH